MKSCKAKLPDGKSCPNQVDEGQDHCPFHLANQITLPKKILSAVLTVLGVAAAVIIKDVVSTKSK
jgi:hypothetical protein